MRRTLAILLTGTFLLFGSFALATGAAAATLAATTTCRNNVDNTGGLGLICEVTVVNHISATGATATVTVRECHGAAGVPETACKTTTSNLTEPVTAVTQCNGSINGGGGTLRCSVNVTNEYTGVSAASTAVTVNQCVGSGSITTGCDPFPATTSGAAITQCNGSAGGGTLVQLTCTATGTMSASHGVTINQCNGSANGGGSLVICSASISNAVASPATPGPRLSPPNTDTVTTSSAPSSGQDGPLLAVIFGLALVALFSGSFVRSVRRR